MIVVAGTIAVKPERREDAVRAALDMVAATRTEPGCLSYTFYADLVNPSTFFVFEEWESADALAKHFETPHMAAFQKQVPELLAGALAIKRYVVESAAGM